MEANEVIRLIDERFPGHRLEKGSDDIIESLRLFSSQAVAEFFFEKKVHRLIRSRMHKPVYFRIRYKKRGSKIGIKLLGLCPPFRQMQRAKHPHWITPKRPVGQQRHSHQLNPC